MEAKLVAELPDGEGWQYRAEVGRLPLPRAAQRDEVELQSKSGKPLGRYFPEMVEMLARPCRRSDFVLDGELVIPVGDTLSFDALQMRLHPAESRIRKLAARDPGELMRSTC